MPTDETNGTATMAGGPYRYLLQANNTGMLLCCTKASHPVGRLEGMIKNLLFQLPISVHLKQQSAKQKTWLQTAALHTTSILFMRLTLPEIGAGQGWTINKSLCA